MKVSMISGKKGSVSEDSQGSHLLLRVLDDMMVMVGTIVARHGDEFVAAGAFSETDHGLAAGTTEAVCAAIEKYYAQEIPTEIVARPLDRDLIALLVRKHFLMGRALEALEKLLPVSQEAKTRAGVMHDPQARTS